MCYCESAVNAASHTHLWSGQVNSCNIDTCFENLGFWGFDHWKRWITTWTSVKSEVLHNFAVWSAEVVTRSEESGLNWQQREYLLREVWIAVWTAQVLSKIALLRLNWRSSSPALVSQNFVLGQQLARLFRFPTRKSPYVAMALNTKCFIIPCPKHRFWLMFLTPCCWPLPCGDLWDL